MSERREGGDVVLLTDGLLGAVRKATIVTEDGHAPCMLSCGDPECREWATLHDEDGNMHCHVSECQMKTL